MTRRVEHLGALMCAACLNIVVYLLLVSPHLHRMWIREPQLAQWWLLFPLALLCAHWVLGKALVRRRKWARSSVLLLGLFHLWLFAEFLYRMGEAGSLNGEMFRFEPVMLFVIYTSNAALGGYTLWTLLRPDSAEIAWE